MGDPAKKRQNGHPAGGNKNFSAVHEDVTMRKLDNSSESDDKPAGRSRYKEVYKDQQTDNELELAFSENRILEGYPFYGTLLKSKSTGFRIQEVIQQAKPITIDQVEDDYGAGEYQLRIKGKNDTKEINFTIPAPESEQQSSQNINDELQNKQQAFYERQIQSLEGIVNSQRTELEQQSRKIRRLQEGEFERMETLKDRHEQKVQRLNEKIDELKDDLRDKKDEVREKEIDLKLAKTDGGSTINEVIDRILGDDGLMKMFMPLLQSQIPNQQLPAASPSAQQARTNPEEQQQPQNQQQDMNSQTAEAANQQQQISKSKLLQQFVDGIYTTAVKALTDDNVGADRVREVVDHNMEAIQQYDVTLKPQHWINIAKELITFVTQNDIETESLGEVIYPVLQKLPQTAIQGFKHMPISGAMTFLSNQYDLQMSDTEQQILQEVLKYFKEQI